MTPNTLPVPNPYLSKHSIEMSKMHDGIWTLLFLPDQSQPLSEKWRHLGYFCRLSLDRYQSLNTISFIMQRVGIWLDLRWEDDVLRWKWRRCIISLSRSERLPIGVPAFYFIFSSFHWWRLFIRLSHFLSHLKLILLPASKEPCLISFAWPRSHECLSI